MKATFKYTESSKRLGTKKSKQKTLELPEKFTNAHKQIEDIERWFKSKMSGGWLSDTEIKVKAIKIGNREFQL